MKIYGLKNCDSCKKALSQLRAAGHEVAFFDIRTDPLDQSQIADLLVELKAEMENAAKQLDFEQAAKLRDRIFELEQLMYS